MSQLIAKLYVWSGALAFVCSLLYFAHFFGTLTPAPPMMPLLPALLTDAALFSLFAVHHSIMARSGAKRWLARHLPPELERTTYVWAASLLFVATCAFWRDLPGTVYQTTGMMRVIGFGLQASGVGVIALSVAVLDPLELAGIRPARARKAGTGTAPQGTSDNALRVRGPYRWVRHPIYLGWILIVFSAPDMPATRLAFSVISTAYLVIAIPWEERSMTESIGDPYQRYQDRVRWRVLPGLW